MTEALLREYHVARWRRLAERRLEPVTDLCVSGRWARYFAERDFLEIVRQSKELVEAWQKLSPPAVGEDRVSRLLGVLDTALGVAGRSPAVKPLRADGSPAQGVTTTAAAPRSYEPAVLFPAPRTEPQPEPAMPPPPLLPPSPFASAAGASLPRRAVARD